LLNIITNKNAGKLIARLTKTTLGRCILILSILQEAILGPNTEYGFIRLIIVDVIEAAAL